MIEHMYIILNFLLLLDLYFILTNPFKPQRMRMIYYKGFCIAYILGSIMMAIGIRLVFYTRENKKTYYDYPFILTEVWPIGNYIISPIIYYGLLY